MATVLTGQGNAWTPYTATGGDQFSDVFVTNMFMRNFPNAKNGSSNLLKRLEKGSPERTSGRYTLWPVVYGWDTGVGNIGYSGYTPEAGYNASTICLTLPRIGRARMQIEGDLLRHAKPDQGTAYIESLMFQTEQIFLSIAMDRARQVHNDGSGRIAEVVSISSSGIVLKVNSSIEGAASTKAAGTLDADGFIHVGMRLCAIVPNATDTTMPEIRAATVASGSFTAIGQNAFYVKTIAQSGENVLITCSGTPTGAATNMSGGATFGIAAGDWICRCHIAGSSIGTASERALAATSYRNEIMGIGGIFTDGGVLDSIGPAGAQQTGYGSMYEPSGVDGDTNSIYFQGASTSTSNPWNRAVILDNGAAGRRPLTHPLLQSSLSDAERINGANIDVIMSAFPAYDSYVATLTPDKRYVNTTELHGGHKVVDFNGVPWEKDRFHYQNCVSFLALDQIQMLEVTPIKDLTIPGHPIWNRVNETAGDREFYWRGWEWEDQVIVKGVRNRCGARLVELSA